MKEQILKLKAENPSWGCKRIAKIVGCSASTARFHISPERKAKVYAYRKSLVGNIKQILVDMKGGKCEVCGYSRCNKALDFHHRNPLEKDFEIKDTRSTKANAKILKEVEKCALLCANCHRELHAGLIKLDD